MLRWKGQQENMSLPSANEQGAYYREGEKATRFGRLSNHYISIPFCRKAALIEVLKLYSVLAGRALATLSSRGKESEWANFRLREADCCPVQTTFLQCPSSSRSGPTTRNKSIIQTARPCRHPATTAAAGCAISLRVSTRHLVWVQGRH